MADNVCDTLAKAKQAAEDAGNATLAASIQRIMDEAGCGGVSTNSTTGPGNSPAPPPPPPPEK